MTDMTLPPSVLRALGLLSVTRLAPTGYRMQFDPDVIRHIGLQDLRDIAAHFISREGDCRIHEIEFVDGRQLRVVVTAQGGCKMEAGCVSAQLLSEGHLVLTMAEPSQTSAQAE
ncbi:hypothetical protein [Dyella sp. 20L07]|uniref:hypothetical protein n=1 Tax=Dyella sp. 20L07 TaxID=3384240 RepID=UPI003D2D1045